MFAMIGNAGRERASMDLYFAALVDRQSIRKAFGDTPENQAEHRLIAANITNIRN